MTQLVFVPLSRTSARRLRDSETATSELSGYAATPALMASHDFDASGREDGEYAALTYAGAHAAIAQESIEPLRLVLAVDVPAGDVTADPSSPYGLVSVSGLRWVDVQALFSDELSAADAVAAARTAAAGRDLDSALTVPAVETAVDEVDLLWFAPDELDRLP